MCSHDLENLEYGRRRPHCKIDGNEFRPVDFRCRVLEFTLNRPLGQMTPTRVRSAGRGSFANTPLPIVA